MRIKFDKNIHDILPINNYIIIMIIVIIIIIIIIIIKTLFKVGSTNI